MLLSRRLQRLPDVSYPRLPPWQRGFRAQVDAYPDRQDAAGCEVWRELGSAGGRGSSGTAPDQQDAVADQQDCTDAHGGSDQQRRGRVGPCVARSRKGDAHDTGGIADLILDERQEAQTYRRAFSSTSDDVEQGDVDQQHACRQHRDGEGRVDRPERAATDQSRQCLPEGAHTQEQDDERRGDKCGSVAPAAPPPSQVHVDRLLRPGQGEEDDDSYNGVGERRKRLCEDGQHVSDEVAGQLNDEDGNVAHNRKCESAACASNLLHHVQPERRAGYGGCIWSMSGTATSHDCLLLTNVSFFAPMIWCHSETIIQECKRQGQCECAWEFTMDGDDAT